MEIKIGFADIKGVQLYYDAQYNQSHYSKYGAPPQYRTSTTLSLCY